MTTLEDCIIILSALREKGDIPENLSETINRNTRRINDSLSLLCSCHLLVCSRPTTTITEKGIRVLGFFGLLEKQRPQIE